LKIAGTDLMRHSMEITIVCDVLSEISWMWATGK